jgi:hypothetical protein
MSCYFFLKAHAPGGYRKSFTCSPCAIARTRPQPSFAHAASQTRECPTRSKPAPSASGHHQTLPAVTARALTRSIPGCTTDLLPQGQYIDGQGERIDITLLHSYIVRSVPISVQKVNRKMEYSFAAVSPHGDSHNLRKERHLQTGSTDSPGPRDSMLAASTADSASRPAPARARLKKRCAGGSPPGERFATGRSAVANERTPVPEPFTSRDGLKQSAPVGIFALLAWVVCESVLVFFQRIGS